jgi:hypothetical protein
MDPTLFPVEYLEQERTALGEHAFKREYLGIPVSGAASPFTFIGGLPLKVDRETDWAPAPAAAAGVAQKRGRAPSTARANR